VTRAATAEALRAGDGSEPVPEPVRARVLAAERLTKRYRGRAVVDGVSFTVHSGEVVGLLGPNGAGKTTSFHMVVGLVGPEAGRVLLDGEEITRLPMHRRARLGLGYLPQEPSIFRKLSVRDNFLAVLEGMKLGRKERHARADALVEEFSLQKVAGALGQDLSGGERRRVEIARALIPQPAFLLFDEPFAGIDPITVQEIQQLIAGVRRRGIGVLVTDHNVREALGICDRAYIIVDGKILEEGAPEGIARSDRARAVYLGEGFRLS
jgi:lipopolysaccharide export system ATP-binding protein